ncbi:MAG: tryptophan-rich sensory protein [Saccharofermentanales bacterium]
MTDKTTKILLRSGCVLGFLGVMAANSLANILPINGYNTGELSDLYPNLFVPAGLTFSVWGVIYLFLLLFTVYQTGILSKLSVNEEARFTRISGLFIISCTANVGWILLWHYRQLLLSVFVMFVLLAVLGFIYVYTRSIENSSWKTKILISAPFSLYFGWITVAAIANMTALLVDTGWSGWGISEEIWTCAMIVVAALLTVLVQRAYKDLVFSGVVVWAVLGIVIRHQSTWSSQYPLVILFAYASIAVVLAGCAWILFGSKIMRSRL